MGNRSRRRKIRKAQRDFHDVERRYGAGSDQVKRAREVKRQRVREVMKGGTGCLTAVLAAGATLVGMIKLLKGAIRGV